MGKHMSIRAYVLLALVLLLTISVIMVLVFSLYNKSNSTKNVSTIQFGQNTLYIYNINGNIYVCTQNISGETCLVAHNSLICPETTCLQIYNIVNIS